MAKSRKKPVRTKGKISMSGYFEEFKEGDRVAIVREVTLRPKFPKRIQGRTGVVESKRGRAYQIVLKDIDREKRFLIAPIHLKKIK